METILIEITECGTYFAGYGHGSYFFKYILYKVKSFELLLLLLLACLSISDLGYAKKRENYDKWQVLKMR